MTTDPRPEQNPSTLHFAPSLWPERHAETTSEFIFDQAIWNACLSQEVDRRWLAGLYKVAREQGRVIVLLNAETLYAAPATAAVQGGWPGDKLPGLDAEYLGVLRHRDGIDGIRSYAREVCLYGLSSVSYCGLGSVAILGGDYSGPRDVA